MSNFYCDDCEWIFSAPADDDIINNQCPSCNNVFAHKIDEFFIKDLLNTISAMRNEIIALEGYQVYIWKAATELPRFIGDPKKGEWIIRTRSSYAHPKCGQYISIEKDGSATLYDNFGMDIPCKSLEEAKRIADFKWSLISKE
jgi:hypothetical protein